MSPIQPRVVFARRYAAPWSQEVQVALLPNLPPNRRLTKAAQSVLRYVRIHAAFWFFGVEMAAQQPLLVLRYVRFLAAIRAFFGGVTLHCDQNNHPCERDDPLLSPKQATFGTLP